jgi:hypothetical protein
MVVEHSDMVDVVVVVVRTCGVVASASSCDVALALVLSREVDNSFVEVVDEDDTDNGDGSNSLTDDVDDDDG